MQKSAQILSELTNYTSIALGPTFKESKLKRMQIVPLNEQTAVAIVVTDTGHVENRVVTIPSSMDAGDLEKMVNIFNERLNGVPLIDLKEKTGDGSGRRIAPAHPQLRQRAQYAH